MTIWDLLARLFASWRGVLFVVLSTVIVLAGMGYVAHTVAEPGTQVSVLNLVTYTKARASASKVTEPASKTSATIATPKVLASTSNSSPAETTPYDSGMVTPSSSTNTTPVELPGNGASIGVSKDDHIATAPDAIYETVDKKFESVAHCVKASYKALKKIDGAKVYRILDANSEIHAMADVDSIFLKIVCVRPASVIVIAAFSRESDGDTALAFTQKLRDELTAEN